MQLVFAVLLACLTQCPGGGCAIPQPTPSPEPEVGAVAWHRHPTDHDSWSLHEGGRLVGVYRCSAARYWRAEPSGVLTPSDPPADRAGPIAGVVGLPPPAMGHASDPPTNYGVDTSRIRQTSGYTGPGGRAVTRAEALRSVGDPLPQDATNGRLTVIGTEAERKPVVEAVRSASAFADLRSTVHLQEYDPTGPEGPMVRGLGFAEGHPSIYWQRPTGEVLARWETNPGAEALAGELRRRRPDYDPAKDPQPAKPSLGGGKVNLADAQKLINANGGLLAIAAVALSLFGGSRNRGT